MRLSMPTYAFMRVPRALLAVPGRRGQYGNTAPEGRVPRAESGAGGARLCRAEPAPARARMSTQVVLAVDGGNSKTYLALLRADGALLALVRGTLSSPHHLGVEGSLEVLARLLADAAREAGLPSRHPSRTSASSSSPASTSRRGGRRSRLPSKRGGGRRAPIVGNDTFAVLRAGTERGWGVAVVCGAGINCVGVAPDGRQARFPALGSITGDWGGGYDVGLAAVSAAAGAKTDAAAAPRSSRRSRATSACGRRPSSPRRSTAAAFRCAP